jgi:hypothetical protein
MKSRDIFTFSSVNTMEASCLLSFEGLSLARGESRAQFSPLRQPTAANPTHHHRNIYDAYDLERLACTPISLDDAT